MNIYGGHFDIINKKIEVQELEKETENINFWNDRQNAEKIIKEINEKKSVISSIENVKNKISDNLELLELLEQEEKSETVQCYISQIQNRTEALIAPMYLEFVIHTKPKEPN